MTKPENRGPRTEKYLWAAFALIIVALYFFGLTIPLVGPDEPRYSQVAREMFERGDLVTTTLGGYNWFEKPVLLYWLQFVSYSFFGVSEFAARLGSVLSGLGTVFFLWLLGKNLTTGPPEEGEPPQTANPDPDPAKWLMLVSASSLGLLVFSRGASFDIILTFPITAALVCYFLFENRCRTKTPGENSGPGAGNRQSYLFLAGFYVFTGLALLAKGLVGIVFPLAIVFFYHLLRFDLVPSARFCFSLLWGIPLVLATASVWYLPVYLKHGWEFIDEFFVQHHFQRYTSNKYRHPQPFWFFWFVLPLMTIPWLPFFLISVYQTLQKKWSALKAGSVHPDRYAALRTYALAWMLFPLVFFSASGSKLPGYILPALPAACILTAVYVRRRAASSANWKRIFQALALAMFLIVALLLQFVVPDYARQDSVKHLFENAATRGYRTEPVISLHTISHNAEFYAAGRLVREKDGGRQKKFLGTGEIVGFLEENGIDTVLVLVPPEYLNELTSSNRLDTELLGESGEVVLAAVKLSDA